MMQFIVVFIFLIMIISFLECAVDFTDGHIDPLPLNVCCVGSRVPSTFLEHYGMVECGLSNADVAMFAAGIGVLSGPFRGC